MDLKLDILRVSATSTRRLRFNITLNRRQTEQFYHKLPPTDHERQILAHAAGRPAFTRLAAQRDLV